MIYLRTPGNGPPWLPAFAASIVAAFKSIMAAPFRLWDAPGAAMPPAADWKQGLVYDSSQAAILYSDGASWIRLPGLGFADGRYVAKSGDAMTGPLSVTAPLVGGPGVEIIDTTTPGAGSGGIVKMRLSNKPSAANLRLGVAHFGAVDSGGAVQNSGAIIAWSGADWGSLASEETYLTFEVTPPASFARIEGARLTSAGMILSGWVRPASFTVAGAPSAAASGAGAMIFVSNESGGAVPAYSDGANWRRVTDRAVIS